MDYSFSQEQEMFRRSVRDFLTRECPLTLVRDIEEGKKDYDPELYRKMAPLGWLGLMLPEEYGGSGGNWVDMAIFYEEAGRALLQSPHFSTVVLGGQTVLAFGSEAQKRNLLPKVASGELIATLALTEPEAGSNLNLLATTATPEGNDYIISGTKLFIGNAHLANYIITVARTGEGVTLFLVDGKSEGLTCTPLDAMSWERPNLVVYDKVRVAKQNILGEVGKGEGIAEIINKAKIMTCAEMVGGAQAAFDMSLNFSKQRIQFDRPIGSFQSLQYKLVNMAIAIDSARWLTYQAAWMNSEGLPCAKESAMAQLEAGRVYSSATADAIHIHGAVAVIRDHDLPLYYRRAKVLQLSMGFSESLEEIIVQGIGL